MYCHSHCPYYHVLFYLTVHLSHQNILSWFMHGATDSMGSKCLFLWQKFGKWGRSSEVMWHFGESIQIVLLNKTFSLHTFNLKSSPRPSPSQYFHLKYYFIDHNTLSTATPPNALKLVTFSQHPEFLWKAEGREDAGFASAFFRKSMR